MENGLWGAQGGWGICSEQGSPRLGFENPLGSHAQHSEGGQRDPWSTADPIIVGSHTLWPGPKVGQLAP